MLTGKICIITGASGGLGAAVCHSFVQNGAIVIAGTGRRSEIPDTAQMIFKQVDVTSESSVKNLISEVYRKHSRIDVLVNLVGGIYPWSNLTDVNTDTWDATINLNLKSVFLCSREVLKVMTQQKSGKIINIGALAGLQGNTQAGPYGAAKAGVINLTQTMAEENKTNNIQINVVIPSIIDTPANRKLMPEANFTQWVRPEEIAETIVFLASGPSSGITGSIIQIPGRL